MLNLGTLIKVEGYTFAYSGMLQLGDKKFLVVAFETKLKDGNKFEIKIVDSQQEIDVVVHTMTNKTEELKPKKVIWDDLDKIDRPKKLTNPTPSLFG